MLHFLLVCVIAVKIEAVTLIYSFLMSFLSSHQYEKVSIKSE
jgi:hypothetical protein